jgi:hypothetical protein
LNAWEPGCIFSFYIDLVYNTFLCRFLDCCSLNLLSLSWNNGDWLQAHIQKANCALYFRFTNNKECEIIVQINGCTMEIEGYGAQLSGTRLYFVVFYWADYAYYISREGRGALYNYLWREKPTDNVGCRFVHSRKGWGAQALHKTESLITIQVHKLAFEPIRRHAALTILGCKII